MSDRDIVLGCLMVFGYLYAVWFAARMNDEFTAAHLFVALVGTVAWPLLVFIDIVFLLDGIVLRGRR